MGRNALPLGNFDLGHPRSIIRIEAGNPFLCPFGFGAAFFKHRLDAKTPEPVGRIHAGNLQLLNNGIQIANLADFAIRDTAHSAMDSMAVCLKQSTDTLLGDSEMLGNLR